MPSPKQTIAVTELRPKAGGFGNDDACETRDCATE